MPSRKTPHPPEVPLESEELLRLFIEFTPAAVALCDREMRYLAHSRRWITDFNLRETNLVGRCHYDIFPEISSHWKEEHQRCLTGETVRKEEEPLHRQDGTVDWVRRELHPWHYPDGRIGGLIMFAEVITEKKKQRDTLRKSEEKFHKLFNENPHGITLSTLRQGRYIEVNPAFLSQIGRKREELIGKTSMEIGLWVHPEERESARKMLNSTGRFRNREVTFRRKSGESYPCEWSAEIIKVNGTKCILSVVTDMSQRKKMEQALKESEEKYRLIVENANDAIFIAQDGVIKFPNPRVVELVNVPAEELEGSPFVQFVYPDDREMVYENYQKRLRGESLPVTYSFRVLRRPEEVRTVQISAVLTQWEGRPASLNFLRDVTEELKLETQLQHAQRMEAIGTLAGGIAHDFNNILMAIQGNISLLLMDLPSSTPHLSRLTEIQGQIKRGAELNRQLLGFARGGKYQVIPARLDQLVHESCEMFGRTKKEIRIFEKHPPDLWTVEVDRTQIEQVFLNLFVNAWQAMPGGGELYVEMENVWLSENYVRGHQVKPGRYVKTSVTDTGTGMDEATMARIFDPFFTTKEMGRGTGLGLASAYGIVGNHGGCITVYSEKGKGSTFNIYLPASETEVREKAPQEQELIKGSGTILLVDDEETILQVAAEMLMALGFNVLTAANGEEAVRIFKSSKDKVDLVILDMIMPGVSGGEVFDAIKTVAPETKVLLSSGYSLNGQAQEILNRGCNGFIQKPFDMVKLSGVIREVLERPSARDPS